MMKTRRVTYITEAIMLAQMEPGREWHLRCLDGVPRDARIVTAAYDAVQGRIEIELESAEWPSTENLEPVPIVYERLHCRPIEELVDPRESVRGIVERETGGDVTFTNEGGGRSKS